VDEVSRGNFDVEVKTQTGIKEIRVLADSLNRIMTTMRYAISKTGATKEEIMTGEKSDKGETESSTSAVEEKPKQESVIRKVVNEKVVPAKKAIVKESLKKSAVKSEDSFKK